MMTVFMARSMHKYICMYNSHTHTQILLYKIPISFAVVLLAINVHAQYSYVYVLTSPWIGFHLTQVILYY